MAEKVTLMRLKVNLQCPCCYKKIKKILCRFPQIRDQVYDKEKNLVMITVVCCSPEKIRDKLCCKGGKVIKSIEIVEPPPPKPKQPEKPKPKEPEKKPKEPEKKPEVVVVEKPTESGKPKEVPKSDPPKKPEPEPAPPPSTALVLVPTEAYPYPCPCPCPCPCPYLYPYPYQPVPAGNCCGPCSEGHGSGPCHYGYGRPAPPPPCYENYGYWYSYERGCQVSRCDYFTEQNTGGCTIM
ncbi:hypothetical protein ACH5RR_017422 [Cinchona calisaya]|uniref:Uncharacterized protein n=1 Tax=Cinchona calisaya TaxID=153742 RepID=A0ABD2ZNG9_9GENT